MVLNFLRGVINILGGAALSILTAAFAVIVTASFTKDGVGLGILYITFWVHNFSQAVIYYIALLAPNAPSDFSQVHPPSWFFWSAVAIWTVIEVLFNTLDYKKRKEERGIRQMTK